jgi:hypothetical protein
MGDASNKKRKIRIKKGRDTIHQSTRIDETNLPLVTHHSIISCCVI